MQTIEERAKEYALRHSNPHYAIEANIKKDLQEAYINGARDQQYIDKFLIESLIDKACKWIKENVECGVHPQSAYGFADRFLKAMKE